MKCAGHDFAPDDNSILVFCWGGGGERIGICTFVNFFSYQNWFKKKKPFCSWFICSNILYSNEFNWQYEQLHVIEYTFQCCRIVSCIHIIIFQVTSMLVIWSWKVATLNGYWLLNTLNYICLLIFTR